jgi:predicted GTPase
MKRIADLNAQVLNQSVLIAVIGRTGCGKTTLINRLRGLPPGDPGEGKVSHGVKEGTITIDEYPVNGTNIVYYDLPGFGSSTDLYRFNDEKSKQAYASHFKLSTIDYFLLVFQGRYDSDTNALAEYIKFTLKKNFSFVQTYMDTLRKNYRDLERTEGWRAVKEKIRHELAEKREQKSIESIFLISNEIIYSGSEEEAIKSYDKNPNYEFDSLVKQIQEDLLGEGGLGAEKAQTFMVAIGCICASAVRAKANILRRQAWVWSFLSGLMGATPVPGISLMLDTAVFLKQVNTYHSDLNLGSRVLQHLLGNGSSDIEKIKHIINVLSTSLGLRAAVAIGAAVTSNVLEEGLKFVPLVGSVAGVGISFTSMNVLLHYLIDFFEIQALQCFMSIAPS